jgi:hypothetical protein
MVASSLRRRTSTFDRVTSDDPRFREYLATDHWWQRRAFALKTADYKCSRCDKHGRLGGAGLQLHHLS